MRGEGRIDCAHKVALFRPFNGVELRQWNLRRATPLDILVLHTSEHFMPVRKETRSISDALADVAYRKQRAALARFSGTPSGQVSSREVYLAACASIGSHLEDSYGFKYAKSGPHARRRSGEFTFQISFQSSHNNVSGEHVALWIHGNVWSPRIKKWRASQGLGDSFDYVAGGQIGNLQTNHCWLDWDLADPIRRDEVIRDAIHVIEELAFPYFARFENLTSLFSFLVREDLPAMTIERAIEFLMCFADQSTARTAAANFLRRRPDLIRAYRRDFERYTERAISQFAPSGYAQQLAFASVAFGLGDLSLERASI